MDLIEQLQRSLHNLRAQRTEQDKAYHGDINPQDMVNNIIADTMNRLETLFVMFNLPSDGFVSITPERKDAQTPTGQM